MNQDRDDQAQPLSSGASGNDPQADPPMPSITAGRTAPYGQPLVNEEVESTYGATEDEVSRGGASIAPTFSDTEPGAGTNYGAAGDPDAPNLGGMEDATTLGPDEVRPPERRLVREGEFEGSGGEPSAQSSYGRSPKHGLGGASSIDPAPRAEDAPQDRQQPSAQRAVEGSQQAGSGFNVRKSAPGGESPAIPTSPRTDAAPGHGDNLGGEGAHAPRPLPGEATQGAASMTNPTTDRINIQNKPGTLPDGKITYGDPQVFAGDGEVGRFGSSSGSAGDLPGGHLKDLAYGGEPVEREVSDTARQPGPPDQTTLTP